MECLTTSSNEVAAVTLGPSGLLDDQPADHAGRFSENDGETSTFRRAMGRTDRERKPVMNENLRALTKHRLAPAGRRCNAAGLARYLFFLYANLLMQIIAPPLALGIADGLLNKRWCIC